MWETDPENAKLMLKGQADYDSLNTVEKHQFDTIIWAYIGVWWTAFDSYNRGMMDDLQWNAWDGSFCNDLPSSNIRVWNSIGGPTFFAPHFVEHFNSCAGNTAGISGDP